ncbi:MAG: PQQ-dependent sugar dehydrogenase [bacterium]|nr:PQQ-dependent sugar dehydrogenase [bacterium]
MKKITTLFFLAFAIVIMNCKPSSTREEYTEPNVNTGTKQNPSPNQIEVKAVAEDLYVPWSIVFTGADRMLFTERNGKLRVIENGKLLDKPLKTFDEVSEKGEEGLMGLAVDPSYNTNRFIYVSYAYKKGDDMKVKVVRFKDNGESLSDEKIITDNLPAEQYHAGCRLRFGPDGKLYITTGDAGERKLAQDIKTLYGKILRVNPDGTIPSDNPYPDNPVWSFGHRNPQGIDWYPGTDIMYSTEHGPSGFDGPGGGDEVNVIIKGGNYGWPEVSHEKSKEGMISPVLVYTPAIAPASGMFYGSDSIPEFKNNFFFGCLRGNGIMRVIVDEKDPAKVISSELLKEVNVGRIREITQGPDGAIYFSTSNQDGRGDPAARDDKIYKISSKN